MEVSNEKADNDKPINDKPVTDKSPKKKMEGYKTMIVKKLIKVKKTKRIPIPAPEKSSDDLDEMMRREHEKEEREPENFDDCLDLTYRKIKRFDKEIETGEDDTGPLEIGYISNEEKALEIFRFVKECIKEKKHFIDARKYDILNIKEYLDRVNRKGSFDNKNYLNLIEKCKMLIESQVTDNVYIEKLKQEIIILNREKNEIIAMTKKLVGEHQCAEKSLTEKCNELKKQNEIANKDTQRLVQANNALKEKEQKIRDLSKKNKSDNNHFKSKILRKNKEIIKCNDMIESNERKIEEFQFREKNQIAINNKKCTELRALRIDISSLKSENERLACRMAEVANENYLLNERLKEIQDKLENCRKTINL
ncbi:MAG: hypothetical protein MJ252_25430 [archaeon]|nr:hypothetical protein [archaeon]